MPQIKTMRVTVKFENRSLVFEAKRDAGLVLAVASVVAARVRFGKNIRCSCLGDGSADAINSFVFAGLGELSRSSFFASLSTIRSQVKTQSFVLALFAFLSALRFKSWLVFAGLLRASMQSKPALFELAATIVWPVPLFNLAGITRRSMGLPSAAP